MNGLSTDDIYPKSDIREGIRKLQVTGVVKGVVGSCNVDLRAFLEWKLLVKKLRMLRKWSRRKSVPDVRETFQIKNIILSGGGCRSPDFHPIRAKR